MKFLSSDSPRDLKSRDMSLSLRKIDSTHLVYPQFKYEGVILRIQPKNQFSFNPPCNWTFWTPPLYVGFDHKMSKFMRFFILTETVIWAFSLLQNTSDGFQTPLQHDEQNVWSLEMCLHTHNISRRCLEVSLEVSEMILEKFGFDPKMSKFLRFFILTVSVIWAFSLLLNTSDGFQTPPKHNEQKVWSREMCLHTHKTFRRCLEVSETSKRKYRQNALMLHLW